MDPTVRWQALHVLTTDELSLEMARAATPERWAIFPLIWEEPLEVETLLQLRVVGVGAEFVAPNPRRRVHMCPSEIDMANPFGELVGLGDDADARAGDDASAGEIGADEEHHSDGGEVGIVVEDGATWHERGSDVEAGDGPFLGLWEAEDAGLGEEAPMSCEGDATEGGAGDHGADDVAELEEVGVKAPTIDALIAASEITPYGNIVCSLEPYASMPRVGRLTDFPSSKPVALRPLAMACFYSQ